MGKLPPYIIFQFQQKIGVMRQLTHAETKAMMEEVATVITKYMPSYSNLLDKYFEVAEDDDDDLFGFDKDETKPDYNKESPKYISGVALVVAISNIDGYDHIFVHTPVNQNTYLTTGMLMEAGPFSY